MPNHCYNRVQLSNNADDDSKQFDELVAKFESQTPFAEILPRPDFSKIKNEDGELPVVHEHIYIYIYNYKYLYIYIYIYFFFNIYIYKYI